jgi:uncharacterized protein RhaS with RHS repeats
MRDYDPTTGRYIQADPLGLVDGASVYGYSLQNPGRYVDPRGEFVAGAVVGGGLNFIVQFGVNWYKFADPYQALRCVDFIGVAASAAIGGFGFTPFKAYKSGGAKSSAAVGVIGALAKAEAGVGQTKLTIDDECECRKTVNEVPEFIDDLALFFQF